MKTVSVKTGSRLHFGLTRVCEFGSGRFGGVGVMISNPATEIQITPASSFKAIGPSRLADFARAWIQHCGVELPACQIEATKFPEAHSGLGSGTQLANTVAAGLNRFLELPTPTPIEVASQLNRGHRSMIGSHGFYQGGLIVDGPAGDQPAQVADRCEIPESWRLVLVCHRKAKKKFGLKERSAFANLETDPSKTAELERIIERELVPAVRAKDFHHFCESVHRFGKLSGKFYTQVQGGIYNGPVITEIVRTMIDAGATGVCQSSWGPTVSSWCENQTHAEKLQQKLVRLFDSDLSLLTSLPCDASVIKVWTAQPQNQPAMIQSKTNPAI